MTNLLTYLSINLFKLYLRNLYEHIFRVINQIPDVTFSISTEKFFYKSKNQETLANLEIYSKFITFLGRFLQTKLYTPQTAEIMNSRGQKIDHKLFIDM